MQSPRAPGLSPAFPAAWRRRLGLALLWIAIFRAPAGADPAWVKASPGGGGAFLTVDVSVTGRVLVGSDLSGAYLGSGSGNWTRLGKRDGLDRTFIACVRWHPASGETALAGGRNGLFRSTDAGATWQRTLGPPGFQYGYFSAIGWSPGHPLTVYAAGALGASDTTLLLWRSADGGASWASVAHDLPADQGLRALELIPHPSDPNTLYMVTGPDGLISPAGTPRRTLYRSTDGGLTWTLRSGGYEPLDLAVHPAGPDTLLMTVSTGDDASGYVLRSTDAGETWTIVLGNTGAVWWDLPYAYLINVRLDSCEPTPSNAGKIRSADGGLTWMRVDTGSNWEIGWTNCRHARGAPTSGVVNALSAGGEYWITPQFVWHYVGNKYVNAFSTAVSPDHWVTKGIDNCVPVCIADAESENTLYTGYYDLGMWRTDDGGTSWRNINPVLPGWTGAGGNVSCVVADSARSGVVWAAIGESSKAPYGYRMYRSADRGDTWAESTAGLPASAFLYGLSLDRQAPLASRRLWVTANGALYRSVDDGATWQPAPTAGGLPTTGLFVTQVDRRNGNVVLVGGWAGLWRTLDGGATWGKLSPGFDHSTSPGEIGGTNSVLHRVKWHGPHQILSDPYTPNKWWVTSYMEDTLEIASLHRGLYLSTDGGTSWSEVRRRPFARGVAIDSAGRRSMLTSSPATTAGSNDNAVNATDGLEIGRSADGLSWTWSPDFDQPDLRFPFGWAVYAGGLGQRWVAVPGYGFMRRPNAPVAGNDAFVVGEGSSRNLLPVLANDYDPDPGDDLILTALDLSGTHGTARIAGDAVSYTPPAGFTGVDLFRYTVRDPTGATGTARVSVNVVAVAGDTLAIPVAGGADDAEEDAVGVMNVGSSDLELTYDTSNQTIGLRFQQVPIPQGTSITAAWIQFRVDEPTSETTSLIFRGQAIDDAPAFTTASFDVSSRALTGASVPWTPPSWVTVGDAGPDQRTPDLSPILAEIVDRPGWASGHSLAFIITGTGRRVAQSWNLAPSGAAVLHVAYGGGSIPVSVEDGAPPAFTLHGVGPTPSRGALRIDLSLPDARPARLDVFDVAGRRVATREVGSLGAGRHRVEVPGRLPAGVYLVHVSREGRAQSAKAVVLD